MIKLTVEDRRILLGAIYRIRDIEVDRLSEALSEGLDGSDIYEGITEIDDLMLRVIGYNHADDYLHYLT
jgi:hypothetical protein